MTAIQRQAHAYGTGVGFAAVTATLSNCSTNHGYLIVLAVTDYAHDPTTDTVSSTSIPSGWSHGNNSVSGTEDVAIWWAYSTSLSNSEAITVTNGSYPAVFAACYSGTSSSPLDQQNDGISQPGPVTPTQSNELIVTACATEGLSSSPTVNSGFSVTDALPEHAGWYVGGGMADLMQTAASATNPTWTDGSSPAAAIMTFKASASSAGSKFSIVMER
jgi:hypothetical protein